MLEPIRLFGLEQAERDQEAHGLRRAHLEWCSTLVPPDAWLDGSEQVRWMQTVQAERSNIAGALDYSLLEHEVAAGLDLFGATFFFWTLSGWAREQLHYADALLRASEGSSRRRTMALCAAGLATWYTWEVAQSWFEQMHAAAKRDPRSRGLALFGLGFCAIVAESYERANTLLRQACELLEATESHVPLAYARYLLGQGHALGRHDYAAARSIAERNLNLVVPGDIWNRANTHAQLGVLDWRAGAFEDARNHLVEAFELQTELGNRFGVAASLEFLAWVAVSENQPERAAQLLGYANRLFERIGMSLFPGFVGDRQEAIDVIRRHLGPGRYRELSDAGARLQPTQVGNLVRKNTSVDGNEANAPTVRELEVAELIARGATNHQISLELLIAHETVKSHVRSILRKLDFDSRVQIAGWYSTRPDGTSDA
jgi:non-specific serine/threonine protein kinase